MAMQPRPRTLAGGFGAFFLVMAFGTWYFPSPPTTPWYGPDLSRWVYMASLVAGTILLAASGAVAVLRSQFLDRRIIELNEQIEALGGVGSLSLGGGDAPPPPPPQGPAPGPAGAWARCPSAGPTPSRPRCPRSPSGTMWTGTSTTSSRASPRWRRPRSRSRSRGDR